MRIRIVCAAVIGLGVLGMGPAAAATLPARAPGLWQSTTTVTGPDGRPLQNAVNVVTVSCVDPSTDLKFFLSNASACSNLDIEGSGDTYTVNGTCSGQGRPTVIDEKLVYASPQSVTLTAKYDAPMGQLTVTSQLQWQGDCLAGMLPGDEGSIDNGAFSKADNINDQANQ